MTLHERNLELFIENERLKEELEAFKRKHNVEYQKLWREHQQLLNKLNMVAEFTRDHYKIMANQPLFSSSTSRSKSFYMKNEKWLPVVGYEKDYMVSNLDRVKTIKSAAGKHV